MNFMDCWNRTKQMTTLKTQTQLASFLGVNDTSISGAKRRGNFPLEWAFKIAQAFNLNTDWILTGHGFPYRSREEAKPGEVREPTPLQQISSGYPTANVMEILCHFGFNGHWLLTGEGPMCQPEIIPLLSSVVQKEDIPMLKLMKLIWKFWIEGDEKKKNWLHVELDHLATEIKNKFPESGNNLQAGVHEKQIRT